MGQWSIEVRPVRFDELAPLKGLADGYRLPFKKTTNTQWFGAFVEGAPIGCCFAKWITADKKTALLSPVACIGRWRGTGAVIKAIETVSDWATEHGATRLEVIPLTGTSALYRGLGFVPVSDGKLAKDYPEA